jgi:alkanesulfonate monooxygenase SsuD/methylene tetrahydromethanopterin reductase-like flavin-dependent oxidoreductase (luciferase family)
MKYLGKDYPVGHRLHSGVSPIGTPSPDLWIMAVDGDKRRQAAERGTCLCYSAFHSRSDRDPDEIKAYMENFKPSIFSLTPYAAIAVNIVCAETHLEARKLAPQSHSHPSTKPIYGTPEECLQQLEQLAAVFGVTEIILNFQSTSPTARLVGCELIGNAFNRR